MWIIKFLVILLVVVLGAALALLNPESVHFDYYLGSLRLSLALILVLSLAAGALIGALTGLLLSLPTRRDNAHLRRKLELAQQEVSNLRTLPLQDP